MTKLINKVLVVNSRRTSMRLCASEWCALEKICVQEKLVRNKLIEIIENNNPTKLGLTYLTRLLTMLYYYEAFIAERDKKESATGYEKMLNLLKKLNSHS